MSNPTFKQSEELTEKVDRADFLNRAYEGGDKYRDGEFLERHKREDKTDFNTRLDLSSYANFTAPVIDAYISFLYRDKPDRQIDDIDEDIINDIDRNGNSLDEFSRHVARTSSIESTVAVIVDKPKSEAGTRQQEIEAGIRPYASMYKIDQWIDAKWRIEDGKYILDKFSVLEGIEDDVSIIKVWMPDAWERWEQEGSKKAELKESGVNPLGEVPTVFVNNKCPRASNKLACGISDIADIADLNRRIYNLDSFIMEITQNTAFPMLEMPDSIGRAASDDSDVEVGTSNTLPIDPENPGAKHRWVEPEHSSLDRLEVLRQSAKMDIESIAKLGSSEGTSTRTESGVALELRFQQLNALLSEKAETMESAEMEIVRLIAKWNGDEFTGDIVYPRKFGIRDLSADIDTAIKAKGVVPSKTFESEQAMRFVNRILKDADKETINKIKEELESTPVGTDANGLDALNSDQKVI